MNTASSSTRPRRDSTEAAVQVKVYEHRKLVFTTPLAGHLEFGRQKPDEAEPYHLSADGNRVVLARVGEVTVSRRHVGLDLLAPDCVLVTNLSAVNTILESTGGAMSPGEQREVSLPATITLGGINERGENEKRDLNLEPVLPQSFEFASLAYPTARPGDDSSIPPVPPRELIAADRSSTDARTMIQWLQATMGVFQSAASLPDFLGKAAKAVVELVGLDQASVLLRQDNGWRQEACFPLSDGPAGQSRLVLEHLLRHKRTFWRTPQDDEDSRSSASLIGVEAYVASPILNPRGDVIGAIYGDRRLKPGAQAAPTITELEAMLVELLSCGVAAGMARLEQERAAVQARVQFEQFFTPQLSRQLQADPTLLAGKEASVSLLFADIRGFSRIAERIGAAATFDWINDVMGALSESVIAHQGVLVDYIGDELIAMWGAPEQLPNHAELACRAALDMLQQLPGLNARWQSRLGEPMGLGIGINTGQARVGNTGSPRKFKYGPLGNAVNLASRVQGATKYVRAPLVITGDTVAELQGHFPCRRLCRVEVVNISEPVALYELDTGRSPRWAELKQRYEAALDAFESAHIREATRLLANLHADFPDDGPTLLLLARAVDTLAHSPADFSPVWKLEGK